MRYQIQIINPSIPVDARGQVFKGFDVQISNQVTIVRVPQSAAAGTRHCARAVEEDYIEIQQQAFSSMSKVPSAGL